MARIFLFENTYPSRTVVTDIEVPLPNGKTCHGAAYRQQSSYASLEHHFSESEVALYGDDAPAKGTPLHDYATSVVAAEARYTSERRAIERGRLDRIIEAEKAYRAALEAEAKKKAEEAAGITLTAGEEPLRPAPPLYEQKVAQA